MTSSHLPSPEVEAKKLEQKLIAACEEKDTILKSGRNIYDAATLIKKRLLENTFKDTLNNLWKDLYNRLTKDELFKPHLKSPEVVRRQIKTSIQGVTNKCDPFEQTASILSSGNLNTAALILFLSLNLVDNPLNQTLILGDPIQNMDDIHVINFASLLRSISRQSKPTNNHCTA